MQICTAVLFCGVIPAPDSMLTETFSYIQNINNNKYFKYSLKQLSSLRRFHILRIFHFSSEKNWQKNKTLSRIIFVPFVTSTRYLHHKSATNKNELNLVFDIMIPADVFCVTACVTSRKSHTNKETDVVLSQEPDVVAAFF